MIYNAYAVRDNKSTFLPPNFDVNDDCAIRNFACGLSEARSCAPLFPSDFDLYHIGSYNNESGALIAICPPRFVCSAVDALALIKEI